LSPDPAAFRHVCPIAHFKIDTQHGRQDSNPRDWSWKPASWPLDDTHMRGFRPDHPRPALDQPESKSSVPTRIRTGVCWMRTSCPRPARRWGQKQRGGLWTGLRRSAGLPAHRSQERRRSRRRPAVAPLCCRESITDGHRLSPGYCTRVQLPLQVLPDCQGSGPRFRRAGWGGRIRTLVDCVRSRRPTS
jgi:hypothetical protein